MRSAASELRRQTFAGFAADEQARLIDALLAVKGNLTRLDASEAGNASRHRGRA